jgi:hypothetical protein
MDTLLSEGRTTTSAKDPRLFDAPKDGKTQMRLTRPARRNAAHHVRSVRNRFLAMERCLTSVNRKFVVTILDTYSFPSESLAYDFGILVDQQIFSSIGVTLPGR